MSRHNLVYNSGRQTDFLQDNVYFDEISPEKPIAESSPQNPSKTQLSLASETSFISDDDIEQERLRLRGSSCIPKTKNSTVNSSTSSVDNENTNINEENETSRKEKTYCVL